MKGETKFILLLRQEIINVIIPFFDTLKTLYDCLKLHDNFDSYWLDCRHYVGLALLQNGEIEKGNAIIDNFISKKSESSNIKEKVIEYRNELLKKVTL